MTDKRQTNNSSRTRFWGIVAVLLTGFMVWAFWPAPHAADMDVVTRGELNVYVHGEGRTKVREIYSVSTPVLGRVLRIAAKAGDAVEADKTVLAVIEPVDPAFLDTRSRAEAKAAVGAAEDAAAQAKAGLEHARAQLKFAKGELDRAQQLRQLGDISQRALEVAELEASTHGAAVKSAEATLKVRRHELETARARLMVPGDAGGKNGDCCIEVRAPIDGQVLRVLQQSEGVVAAGQLLLEVGDPGQLEIVVDLLTQDAAAVRHGAAVMIENWGGPALIGSVRRIEPYGYTKVSVLGIEEQRIDVIIDFTPPAAGQSRPGHGFRVETAILTWHGENVVRVPVSALFRAEGGWFAFVDNAGTARRTAVEVGHMNSISAEVLSGLEPGDRVVVHPGDDILDGIGVRQRAD